MRDLIGYAHRRRGELAQVLSRREAEIGCLRDEIEDLESFLRTAKRLDERAAAEDHQDDEPQAPEQVERETESGSAVPIRMPARHSQSA